MSIKQVIIQFMFECLRSILNLKNENFTSTIWRDIVIKISIRAITIWWV